MVAALAAQRVTQTLAHMMMLTMMRIAAEHMCMCSYAYVPLYILCQLSFREKIAASVRRSRYSVKYVLSHYSSTGSVRVTHRHSAS
jgi:hypothetical protein